MNNQVEAKQADRPVAGYENLRQAVHDLTTMASHLDSLIIFVEHGHDSRPTEEVKLKETEAEPPMNSVVEVLNNAPAIISKRSSEVHCKIEKLQNLLS